MNLYNTSAGAIPSALNVMSRKMVYVLLTVPDLIETIVSYCDLNVRLTLRLVSRQFDDAVHMSSWHETQVPSDDPVVSRWDIYPTHGGSIVTSNSWVEALCSFGQSHYKASLIEAGRLNNALPRCNATRIDPVSDETTYHSARPTWIKLDYLTLREGHMCRTSRFLRDLVITPMALRRSGITAINILSLTLTLDNAPRMRLDWISKIGPVRQTAALPHLVHIETISDFLDMRSIANAAPNLTSVTLREEASYSRTIDALIAIIIPRLKILKIKASRDCARALSAVISATKLEILHVSDYELIGQEIIDGNLNGLVELAVLQDGGAPSIGPNRFPPEVLTRILSIATLQTIEITHINTGALWAGLAPLSADIPVSPNLRTLRLGIRPVNIIRDFAPNLTALEIGRVTVDEINLLTTHFPRLQTFRACATDINILPAPFPNLRDLGLIVLEGNLKRVNAFKYARMHALLEVFGIDWLSGNLIAASIEGKCISQIHATKNYAEGPTVSHVEETLSTCSRLRFLRCGAMTKEDCDYLRSLYPHLHLITA
jgi:hypothetical protein